MAYRIRYTNTAREELLSATDWIAERAPETAERWFDGFVELLATLSTDATVHGLAPESTQVDMEIRQIIYRTASRRSNRALYTIDSDTVVILGIRRPGQLLLSRGQVESRMKE